MSPGVPFGGDSAEVEGNLWVRLGLTTEGVDGEEDGCETEQGGALVWVHMRGSMRGDRSVHLGRWVEHCGECKITIL